MWSRFLVFLFMVAYATGEPMDLVIKVEQGYVRGTRLTSVRSNQTFYGFMGIPYAKAPVGNLRFMPPQSPDHWSGIRNAVKEGANCPQYGLFNHLNYFGEEDCLFINVFIPQLPSDPLPVMIWIHGGDFICGSGDRNIYGPDFFMDEGVIVVTFNYRLGVLGFLSLQNEEVPGNNGLKDQLLALHWVNRNIRNFGGDPHRITIFGESAGGASVHYHLLSPLSRGLFQFAISESGTALNPWAYQAPESSLRLAHDLAEKFGHQTTDPHEIVKILRTVEPKALATEVQKLIFKVPPRLGAIIGPTLDLKATNGSVFLPDIPIKLINSGNFLKVPYITGMNSEEAILITRVLKTLGLLLSPVGTIFRFGLPYFIGEPLPKASMMADEVKLKYFNNSRPFLLKYIDVLTDMFFGNAVYCTAQKQALSSTVYSYEFAFNGTANAVKKVCGGAEFPGAGHADELPYLFNFQVLKVKLPRGSREYITSRRMVRLWTNFAKTGNPTPKPETLLQNLIWQPVGKKASSFLNIDTNLTMKHELNNGHAAWWQKLYKKYADSASPCWTAH